MTRREITTRTTHPATTPPIVEEDIPARDDALLEDLTALLALVAVTVGLSVGACVGTGEGGGVEGAGEGTAVGDSEGCTKTTGRAVVGTGVVRVGVV